MRNTTITTSIKRAQNFNNKESSVEYLDKRGCDITISTSTNSLMPENHMI